LKKHQSEITHTLKKKLIKLNKRDKKLFESVLKKIEEILSSDDIRHFKNLRYNYKLSKRVHIGSFVLIFSYNENLDLISFEDFDHHDNIYKTL